MLHIASGKGCEEAFKPLLEKKNIIDVIMIFKHIIYKLRFRENTVRFPTVKLVLISMILELHKLISLKNKNGEMTDILETVTSKLKQEINWAP